MEMKAAMPPRSARRLLLALCLAVLLPSSRPTDGAAAAELSALRLAIARQKAIIRSGGGDAGHMDGAGNWKPSAAPPPPEDVAVDAAEEAYDAAQVRFPARVPAEQPAEHRAAAPLPIATGNGARELTAGLP